MIVWIHTAGLGVPLKVQKKVSRISNKVNFVLSFVPRRQRSCGYSESNVNYFSDMRFNAITNEILPNTHPPGRPVAYCRKQVNSCPFLLGFIVWQILGIIKYMLIMWEMFKAKWPQVLGKLIAKLPQSWSTVLSFSHGLSGYFGSPMSSAMSILIRMLLVIFK